MNVFPVKFKGEEADPSVDYYRSHCYVMVWGTDVTSKMHVSLSIIDPPPGPPFMACTYRLRSWRDLYRWSDLTFAAAGTIRENAHVQELLLSKQILNLRSKHDLLNSLKIAGKCNLS